MATDAQLRAVAKARSQIKKRTGRPKGSKNYKTIAIENARLEYEKDLLKEFKALSAVHERGWSNHQNRLSLSTIPCSKPRA